MLKNNFLIFAIFLVYPVLALHGQDNSATDYITSGYYQIIYEASISHLEGNDSLSYKKMQDAEKLCPLINQQEYMELDLYVSLLFKYENFSKALLYMNKLATEYGTLAQVLIKIENDSLLYTKLLNYYPNFKNSILPNILEKNAAFYTQERKEIIRQLTEIINKDQSVRMKLMNTIETSPKDSVAITAIKLEMHETDRQNQIQFLSIIDQYGFPNTRLIGMNSIFVLHRIRGIVMHFFDNERLEELLIKYVREGKCEPDIYAGFIDKRMLEKRKKHIYGVFSNAKKDQIFDPEYLDRRRVFIGMPTLEMEQKRNKLLNLE